MSLAAIEPSTREALRACLEYPFASYSPPNLRTLHTFTSSHLSLYRRVSTRYGLVDHCVRASRHIAVGTAVCMLGGRLTESWKIDAQVQLEHGFALKRDELRTFFEYSGEGSLVVLTDQHSNIAKYIRDPLHRHTAELDTSSKNSSSRTSHQRERPMVQVESDEIEESDEEEEDETVGVDSNCRPDTYFDRQSRLFFVLIYATEDIQKGEELFSHRFLGDWRTKAHHEMFLAARVSHWLHRYAMALERRLLTAMAEDEVPPPPAPISVSTLSFWHEAERMVHTAMNGVHLRKRLMEVQTMQTQPQTLAPFSLYDALQLTGCEFARQTVLGRSISSTTKRKLGRLPNLLPAHLVIDGNEHPVSEDDVMQLIEKGHNDELIEVQEVLSVTSPARFFTVPSSRAFCVTAKHPISVGQLISVYAGELEESVQHHGSNYVYNLCRRDAQQHFGRDYDLPDLLLDADAKGGLSRFINDSAWRGGQRDDQRAVNVAVCWAYVKRPVLIVYALKPIAANDELITSYGDEFWSIMCTQSLHAQRRYQCAVRPYIEALEQLCADKALSLPDKPEYDIELEPLFQTKPLPYNRKGTKGPKRENEDGEEEGDVRVKVEGEVREESKEERKEDMESCGPTDRVARMTRARSSSVLEPNEEQRGSAGMPIEQLGRGKRSKRSRHEPVQPSTQQRVSNRPRHSSQRQHSGAAKEEWLGDKPAFVTAVEDEQEYTVERIVKEAGDKYGKRWYLVKWLGWPETDNSWVKEADMECDELLAAFKEEQQRRMEEIVQRIKETKQRNKETREQEWRAMEEEWRRQEEERSERSEAHSRMDGDSESDRRRRSGRARKPPPDPHEERQAALLLEPRRPQRSVRQSVRVKQPLDESRAASDEADRSAGPEGEDRSLAEMLAERGWMLSRPAPAQHDSVGEGVDGQHDDGDEQQAGMEEEESGESGAVAARVIASVGRGGGIAYNQTVPSFALSLASAVSHFRTSAEVALPQSQQPTADEAQSKGTIEVSSSPASLD